MGLMSKYVGFIIFVVLTIAFSYSAVNMVTELQTVRSNVYKIVIETNIMQLVSEVSYGK